MQTEVIWESLERFLFNASLINCVAAHSSE
jgi:hypothetical protein